MTCHKFKYWLFAFFACLLLVVIYSCLPGLPIPAHKGDGEFRDESYRLRLFSNCPISPFYVREYSIYMPRFSLARDFSATYHIGRMSQLARACSVYLAIEDPKQHFSPPSGEIKLLTHGSLTSEAIGKTDSILGRSEGRLCDYEWSFLRGAHRLYKISESVEFVPHWDQTYTLRIDYKADPRLFDFMGYCYVQCN